MRRILMAVVIAMALTTASPVSAAESFTQQHRFGCTGERSLVVVADVTITDGVITSQSVRKVSGPSGVFTSSVRIETITDLVILNAAVHEVKTRKGVTTRRLSSSCANFSRLQKPPADTPTIPVVPGTPVTWG